MGTMIEFLPLILPLLAGFSWLIRLEALVKSNKREADDARAFDRKETAGLVHNLRESRIDPLEREVLRLENEHVELSKIFSSETKEIRQELGRHLGLLNDIRVLLAEMKGKMDDGSTTLVSKHRDRDHKPF